MFNLENAMASPAWLKELNNVHTPETEEYGISSFVFKAKKPFHPERLLNYLNSDDWDNVIRSKGYMWLATRNDYGAMWSQAGTSCKLEPAGKWMAIVPEEEWPVQDDISKDKWRSMISGEFGDRRQEFVIIGKNLDKERLVKNLSTCLLNEEELNLGFNGWSNLKDPFPEWNFDLSN
jgi:G3E family GTPase